MILLTCANTDKIKLERKDQAYIYIYISKRVCTSNKKKRHLAFWHLPKYEPCSVRDVKVEEEKKLMKTCVKKIRQKNQFRFQCTFLVIVFGSNKKYKNGVFWTTKRENILKEKKRLSRETKIFTFRIYLCAYIPVYIYIYTYKYSFPHTSLSLSNHIFLHQHITLIRRGYFFFHPGVAVAATAHTLFFLCFLGSFGLAGNYFFFHELIGGNSVLLGQK